MHTEDGECSGKLLWLLVYFFLILPWWYTVSHPEKNSDVDREHPDASCVSCGIVAVVALRCSTGSQQRHVAMLRTRMAVTVCFILTGL